MFRWASLLCSLIASAVFVVTVFVITVGNGCPDRTPLAAMSIVGSDMAPLSPQFQCASFYDNLSLWFFLCTAGLTVLLLIIHLMVAAKQRAWGWLTTLLLWPPLCFICGAAIVGQTAGATDGGLTITIFCALGGLVNFLFGIVVLKPWQAVPKAFPSAAVPPS